MGAEHHIDWASGAVSVLDWWREAGVDVLVSDEPRDWLARIPVAVPSAVAETTFVTALPDTLAAFVAWRTGVEAPEGAGGILSEGNPAADIMVVTDFPDGDGLIGEVAGRLFDRMLAAIGLRRDSIYLTTLSTTRPLGGRIAPEAIPRLAELLLHHIALVSPKRLLTLGQAPSRAVTGTDASRGSRNLQPVNLQNGTIESVTSLHPRHLIDQPRLKGEAWKDLRLLIGEPVS